MQLFHDRFGVLSYDEATGVVEFNPSWYHENLAPLIAPPA